MVTKPNSVLFMGTPGFAAEALRGLVWVNSNVVGVVCRPDEKSGRGALLTSPAVKIEAEKHGLPVFQPHNKAELTEIVQKLKPELIVVAAYGMIIPQAVLDVPKFGTLNIHGSLLPKYRGASPIAEAILNGDQETGITIMKMSLGMDEGDMIATYKLPIADNDTTATLTEKMSRLGARAIVETVPDWIQDELTAIPQKDSDATYCRKITKEDGHIDWEKPAVQIERMVRAYQPWPTAYTFVDKTRVKILGSSLCEKDCDMADPNVGVLHFGTGHICVRAGKGILKITELQPEGKKLMTAKDYINGNKSLDKTKLT